MKTSSKSSKKASTKPAQPTFHSTVRSKADIHKALEQRDSLRVERFSDELEAGRIAVIALNDFIFDVLARPGIKTLAKPGAAVVRVLMAERGMSTFTANRVWNEFKAMATAQ
jgi:hypothetical protein